MIIQRKNRGRYRARIKERNRERDRGGGIERDRDRDRGKCQVGGDEYTRESCPLAVNVPMNHDSLVYLA
jgi:hypothetical protein